MKGKFLFVVVIVVIILLVSVSVPKVYDGVVHFLYPLEHEQLVKKYADKYGLDRYFVLGVIKAESNFVTDAKSHQGAAGLMQLTENTATWIAEKNNIGDFNINDLSDPETNIMLGCWYLDYLIDAYDGDLTLALCAYNAGSGNVAKWLGSEEYSKDGKTLVDIPFSETKEYVKKIMEYRQKYKELYPGI